MRDHTDGSSDVVAFRAGDPDDYEPALAVWAATRVARSGIPPSAEEVARRREALHVPGTFLAVGEDHGTVVAMATAVPGRADNGAGQPIPGLCFIPWVYVAPDRWGQGIGRRLVEGLLNEARSRGYRRAMLLTAATNQRARRLYEGCGFRVIWERVSAGGEATIAYERALDIDP